MILEVLLPVAFPVLLEAHDPLYIAVYSPLGCRACKDYLLNGAWREGAPSVRTIRNRLADQAGQENRVWAMVSSSSPQCRQSELVYFPMENRYVAKHTCHEKAWVR